MTVTVENSVRRSYLELLGLAGCLARHCSQGWTWRSAPMDIDGGLAKPSVLALFYGPSYVDSAGFIRRTWGGA